MLGNDALCRMMEEKFAKTSEPQIFVLKLVTLLKKYAGTSEG